MAEVPPPPTFTSPAEGAVVVGQRPTITGTGVPGATVTVRNLPLLGLGTSVGTPPEGITADVWVVRFAENLPLGQVRLVATQTNENGTSAEAFRTITVQRG